MKTTSQVLVCMERVALTPREWLSKTKLSNPAFVCGQNRPDYGGCGAYIYRDAVEPEPQHLGKFLDAGSASVDVGACTGVYTSKAARCIGPHGIVAAIEPSPEVLAALQHGVQVYGFNKVQLHNLCLGDHTGVSALWTNFGKPNSPSLVQRGPDSIVFLDTRRDAG